VQLRVHVEALEVIKVSQRKENLSVQFSFQVNVAFSSISETKVDHEIVKVFGGYYSRYQTLTPTMGFA